MKDLSIVTPVTTVNDVSYVVVKPTSRNRILIPKDIIELSRYRNTEVVTPTYPGANGEVIIKEIYKSKYGSARVKVENRGSLFVIKVDSNKQINISSL